MIPAKFKKGFTSPLRGFTLIELLVVISIIGILATLLVANFIATRERGRDARRKSDLSQVRNALQLYYTDYEIYPTNTAGYEISGCGADGTSVCPWGSTSGWVAGGRTYMSQLPEDPVITDYFYQQVSSDEYILEACLENLSDETCQTPTVGGWCTSNCVFRLRP